MKTAIILALADHIEEMHDFSMRRFIDICHEFTDLDDVPKNVGEGGRALAFTLGIGPARLRGRLHTPILKYADFSADEGAPGHITGHRCAAVLRHLAHTRRLDWTIGA